MLYHHGRTDPSRRSPFPREEDLRKVSTRFQYRCWLVKSLMLELAIETGNLLYPRDGKPKALDQSPVPPLYEFVTWTDASGNTNAAARKLVRSYTMRHSKLRQNQSNHPCNVQHHSGSLVGLSRNSQNHSGTLKDEFREFLALMPHEVSTLDPFDCLPVRMQPYMLDLFTKCKHDRYISRLSTDSATST